MTSNGLIVNCYKINLPSRLIRFCLRSHTPLCTLLYTSWEQLAISNKSFITYSILPACSAIVNVRWLYYVVLCLYCAYDYIVLQCLLPDLAEHFHKHVSQSPTPCVII